jgi:hypothetical protein
MNIYFCERAQYTDVHILIGGSTYQSSSREDHLIINRCTPRGNDKGLNEISALQLQAQNEHPPHRFDDQAAYTVTDEHYRPLFLVLTLTAFHYDKMRSI